MPMSAPVRAYSYNELLPLYPDDYREIAVNLPPNVTYKAGQLLASTGASANAVQTVTITGTPAGGTFTLTGTNPTTGDSVAVTSAYNVATATLQTNLAPIYGAGNVTVTGTAGTSYVVSLVGNLANRPIPLLTATHAFTGGSSPNIAVANTTTGGAGGVFQAYNSGGSGGVELPKLLLRYDSATDASGGITLGNQAGSEFGAVQMTTPAYYTGTFRCEDLVGLDSNAVGKIGKLIYGTVAKGAIRLF